MTRSEVRCNKFILEAAWRIYFSGNKGRSREASLEATETLQAREDGGVGQGVVQDRRGRVEDNISASGLSAWREGAVPSLKRENSGRSRLRVSSRVHPRGDSEEAVGPSSPTFKGEAWAGGAVSSEIVLCGQEGSRSGLRAELWGCRTFRDHRPLYATRIVHMLTGVLTAGGVPTKYQPRRSLFGHSQVP